MSTPGRSAHRTIDRARLKNLMAREAESFVAARPESAALYARAQKSLVGGVPMNWMKSGPANFPCS